jgi:hypothetical protein
MDMCYRYKRTPRISERKRDGDTETDPVTGEHFNMLTSSTPRSRSSRSLRLRGVEDVRKIGHTRTQEHILFIMNQERESQRQNLYMSLHGELEHLKIKTRLIDEMFTSVMGMYFFLK